MSTKHFVVMAVVVAVGVLVATYLQNNVSAVSKAVGPHGS